MTSNPLLGGSKSILESLFGNAITGEEYSKEKKVEKITEAILGFSPINKIIDVKNIGKDFYNNYQSKKNLKERGKNFDFTEKELSEEYYQILKEENNLRENNSSDCIIF